MAIATPVTRPFPFVEGVEHRFVDVYGLTMHVAEAGAGDPLLLLHGWPQHWYQWRHQIPALAEHYRVIAPDLRGFGWTDAPRGAYDKETLAQDVVNLLDVLELDRVRLMAHDWGGWIGFLLCLFHPERFERYVALNITPPWGNVDLPTVGTLWRFWYQALIAAPGLGRWVVGKRPEFLRWMIQGSSQRPAAWTDEDVEAFIGPLTEPARTEASVRLYRTFLTRELPALARGRYDRYRLTTPTLLLFGMKDLAIAPRLLEGHESHADDLTIERIPDTGHFIGEERPELVNERALEFFGRG